MVKIREVFCLKVKGEGNGIGLCWQVILEIRKEEDYISPVWIVLGSSLGGLLLLALLVLALWKVHTHTHTGGRNQELMNVTFSQLGFFSRRRLEEEEQPVANGKAAEELSQRR